MTTQHLCQLAVVTGLLISACAGCAVAEEPEFGFVFQVGKEDIAGVTDAASKYAQYRATNVVVTNSGAIVVVCQGRHASTWSDRSGQDLLAKRSTDNGATWSGGVLVASHGEKSIAPNAAVYDRTTGRIHVLYNMYEWSFKDPDSRKTLEGPECRQFQVTSDDEGRTWSRPRDISAMMPPPGEKMVFGAGEGIQLRRGPRKGRLIVPGGDFEGKPKRVGAFFSDDAGKTWRYSKFVMCGAVESAIAELPDGTLIMNNRGQKGFRRRSFSRDAGETWAELEDDKGLPAVSCNASVITYSDPLDGEKPRLVYAGPVGPKRTHGTAFVSYDGGRTWPVRKLVTPDEFAYSSLLRLPDGRIGLVYESHGHTNIKVARFSLAWLTSERTAKPQAADSKRVMIVEGGKPVAVRYGGKAWVQKDGYVEGGGKGNPLVANCEILEGDFRISARLRMLKQKGSAASFAMDRNHFGFEGAREKVYLNGRIFAGLKQLKPSPDVFERGAWIDFDVIRRGAKVSFLIDGRLIVTAPYKGEGFREILFHPARSTMQIQQFSIAGNVGKVGKVEKGMSRGYSLPVLDLNDHAHRQVVVDREKGQYLGHPTTVLLDDNKTMIAVYPKGHGRGAIVMKRSTDAGLTWSKRLPTPTSWATSKEVPTIYPVVDRQGVKRLILFSGLYPTRMAVSEDDGKTWGELEPVGDWGGIVVMSDLIRLKSGDYMVMFHDDGRFFTAKSRRTGTMTLFKSFSSDGGLTWSQPEAIFARSDVHLCEPGFVRSPDGRQIAVLLRENARRRNSYVIFSDDEGKTWSDPRELPGALTGDRHQCVYAPDGRLFISFRDRTHESPTKGDWVGWVGTYDDIVAGREGQYRVRLKDNHKGADCSYPALELLPDGTIVATTYGHWAKGEAPYILSVRFKIEELDAMAKRLSTKITIPQYDLSDQKQRRVIVDKIADRYLGQPDTVLLKDGRTILVCYPNGHGGPDTVMKRSDDGGLTWSDRLPVPESFLGDHNAPTIHRVTDAKGVERLILFVSHPVMKLSVSEDEGKTWSPLKPVFPDEMKGEPGYKGHAPPKSVVRLTDGRYLAIYHDHYTQDGKKVVESLQILSKDGGLTWSAPRCVTRHPLYPGAHPCEPAVIRSPDGEQLLCMLRENSRSGGVRRYNSMYMVSNDEGATWSDLKEMPGALKGDRHIPRYTPDGRIITTIRDVNEDSATYGDFVLWVGTYADILAGREGQYRVRLLDNKSPRIGDTGYAGLELLPDRTFVSTTYCVLNEGEQPLIVSVRFTLDELDALAGAGASKSK